MVAVVPFDWRGRGALPEDIAEIVTQDLGFSGRFKTLPVSSMLSLPNEAAEVFVRDWRLLDVEYLVLGRIESQGLTSPFLTIYITSTRGKLSNRRRSLALT